MQIADTLGRLPDGECVTLLGYYYNGVPLRITRHASRYMIETQYEGVTDAWAHIVTVDLDGVLRRLVW